MMKKNLKKVAKKITTYAICSLMLFSGAMGVYKGFEKYSVDAYASEKSGKVDFVASVPDGSRIEDNAMEVTVEAFNTDVATYELTTGEKGTFVGSKTFVVGKGLEDGEIVTIIVKGSNEYGDVKRTFTYTKSTSEERRSIYFEDLGNYTEVYAYAFNKDGEGDKELCPMPGKKMEKDGDMFRLTFDYPNQYKYVKFTCCNGNAKKVIGQLEIPRMNVYYIESQGWGPYILGGKGYSYSNLLSCEVDGETLVTFTACDSMKETYSINGSEPMEFNGSITLPVGNNEIDRIVINTIVRWSTEITTTREYVYRRKQVDELKAELTVNGWTNDISREVGSEITLDARAVGGSEVYTYKFAVLNVDNGKWSVLRDFNDNSSYTYALNYPGRKQFAVTVKDSKGRTVATNRINVNVEDNTEPLSGILSVNGSTETLIKTKGSQITLDASAQGGSGEYTYKFAVLNVDNGKWSVLRDFSDNSSYTYALNYPGTKQFAVTVKDSTGKTVATNRITVKVADAIASLSGSLKVNGSTASLVKGLGSLITLNASGHGGSENYTYKFAVLNVETGKWSVLRDFNSDSTYTYVLKYPVVKQFAVTVKDSTGKTVATNRITVTVLN